MRHLVILAALLLAPLAALSAEPITNSIGMKLVRIEPGTFTMGQEGPPIAGNGNMATHHAEFRSADWDEKPAHRVTITQPFYMASTEVTLGQFRRFDPDFRKGKGAEDDAVHAITWTKAVAFCEWLSKKEGQTYRLPTEAEWEYACRAGTTTLFHTGDTLPAGHQKWFGRQGWRELYFPDGQMPPEYAWQDGAASLRVAQTAPNAWGLYDMHGNLAEWCLDWYGPYESGDQTDPLGRSDGDFRGFRGGSHSQLTRMLRSANRSGWIPDAPLPWVGFRVVLGDLPKGKLAAAAGAAAKCAKREPASGHDRTAGRGGAVPGRPPVLPPDSARRGWAAVHAAQPQPRPHRVPERRSARRLVFVCERAGTGAVQRCEPTSLRREGLGAAVALLGRAGHQRPCAEGLVGRREDALPSGLRA